MLESTFVGLQALAGEQGADPALVAAAGEALATLLGRAKGQLDEALGRDVVYQVRGRCQECAVCGCGVWWGE